MATVDVREGQTRPEYRTIVAANVYAARHAKDPRWSQEKLAREAELSVDTIRLIESAKDGGGRANALRLDTLAAIADALGVDASDLLRWDVEATRVYLQGGQSLSALDWPACGERRSS